jgi:RND family efflux transporter MFP subunit
MKQKIVVGLVMAGIVAVGVMVQVKVTEKRAQLAVVAKEAEAKQSEQGKKVPPQLAMPLPGPATQTLHLTGSLKAEAEVSLGFKVPGRVVELGVKRGDVVKAGAFLARLDARDFDAQMAQADAGMRAAEAQRSIAADAARRVKQLQEAGAATDQQVVQASGQTSAISATIQQAGAARRYLEVVRGETRLTSPIDGVVVSAPTAPGFVVQMMSPPSFTIQRLSTLKFHGHLTDRDAARIQSGMAFEVESDAGIVKAGTLDVVIPSVDMLTRRVPIEGTVPNPDGKLFAGAMVEARVAVASEPSLSIPLTCLLTGSTPAVLVVDGSKQLVRREVTVLRSEGDRLLVKSGLQATDQVLANPGVQWREGDRVP